MTAIRVFPTFVKIEGYDDDYREVPDDIDCGICELTARRVAERSNDDAGGELFYFEPGGTEPERVIRLRKKRSTTDVAFRVSAESSIAFHATRTG